MFTTSKKIAFCVTIQYYQVISLKVRLCRTFASSPRNNSLPRGLNTTKKGLGKKVGMEYEINISVHRRPKTSQLSRLISSPIKKGFTQRKTLLTATCTYLLSLIFEHTKRFTSASCLSMSISLIISSIGSSVCCIQFQSRIVRTSKNMQRKTQDLLHQNNKRVNNRFKPYIVVLLSHLVKLRSILPSHIGGHECHKSICGSDSM